MTDSMMRPRAPIAALAAAGLLALSGLAYAGPPEGKGPKHKDRGHSHAQADRDQAGNPVLIRVDIGVGEVRQIASELRLGGYPSLPPGIRKNLARGKPLPPGIAKRLAPDPLRARLPVYAGYEWRVAGTDLLLVAVTTAVIAEVFSDVFD